MGTVYTFVLRIEVTDVMALYEAASERADEGGCGNSIEEIIGTAAEPDVFACVQMLLDPGESPQGTSIIESMVEAESTFLDD